MRYTLVLLLLLVGCGRSPMAPTALPSPTPAPQVAQVPPPPLMQGYFVSSGGAPRAITPGSVSIVVPSWGDSAEAIAAALTTRGAWALVAVADQQVGGGDWPRTRAWLAPIERTGRLVGIYVADEPFLNGWTQAQVSSALAPVSAAGYRTMVAEASGSYTGWRPPSTWFGLTAYYDPLLWTLKRYQEDPGLNVVFGDRAAEGKWRDFAGWVGKPLFLWSLDMGDGR